MSYLVVKTASNATPESYQLTDAINAPRLAVSGSYVPITAGGGSAGDINIADGNSTYRVMRTTTSSHSQSASATFLTSAVDSAGLSNTTALTRASTSATLTRSSASGTSYGTKLDAKTYYTSMDSYSSYTRDSQHNGSATTWYTYHGTATATNPYSNYYIRMSGTLRFYLSVRETGNSPYGNYTNTTYDSRSTYNYTVLQIAVISSSVATLTTGTSYLTRSSISGYGTRESTSGYTGISSSSSSESESATCWA